MEPVLGTTGTLTIFVPKNVSCVPETKSGQEQRQVQGRLRDCIQENGKWTFDGVHPHFSMG